ncbi:D-2-hydroxyacid dehydrogenase [Sphingomonas sp.]|uniref:D-2-hydroxyacid dehydrogenase n=1 Tax=Sphingomonas sp. TaxID=28214 RepID=UPI0025E0D4BF|nr:D-2-hydroxyacid dehydrogenase [Sphingomonas sp.]
MTTAVLSAMVRPFVEPYLPIDIDVNWFATKAEALEYAPGAEIGWFDLYKRQDMLPIIHAATKMKWLNSLYAGVDGLPLDLLADRGVVFTNGAGINAITIAEYVVMGMLTIAKGYRQVVQAQDRHEWLRIPPGRAELAGSKALLIGYGAIGKLIEKRLAAFDVDISKVRRTTGDATTLGPDDWRARLGEFDWIILALPATPETEHLIGRPELDAMKPTATLLNISRGSVIDQDALVDALSRRRIAAAFLDVTTPEPLPPHHSLWTLDNAHITMHLSGQSQDKMAARAAALFLENLNNYLGGKPLANVVDLRRGY